MLKVAFIMRQIRTNVEIGKNQIKEIKEMLRHQSKLHVIPKNVSCSCSGSAFFMTSNQKKWLKILRFISLFESAKMYLSSNKIKCIHKCENIILFIWCNYKIVNDVQNQQKYENVGGGNGEPLDGTSLFDRDDP